jgi:hypothetical protein
MTADQRLRKNGHTNEAPAPDPVPSEDHLQVVVPYEEWRGVQQQIRNNFRHVQGKTHPLFQRLLYCSTCQHFLAAHGTANGKTKYACENDREGRVKLGNQTGEHRSEHGYYCGQQLWEEYLEYPAVRALDEAVREWKPDLDVSEELEKTQVALSHARGVETREKADVENPEKPYEIAAVRLKKAHANVKELENKLEEFMQKDKLQEQLKQILKVGFMAFYYGERRTKEQRQGILQHFIRRIDVGAQELTVSWLFVEGKKRRIPRSQVDPKGGHGEPLQYQAQVLEKGDPNCRTQDNDTKEDPLGASDGRLVEIGGLEPPTSCMPCRRSPS